MAIANDALGSSPDEEWERLAFWMDGPQDIGSHGALCYLALG